MHKISVNISDAIYEQLLYLINDQEESEKEIGIYERKWTITDMINCLISKEYIRYNKSNKSDSS